MFHLLWFATVPPSISGETTVPREVQVTQDSIVTLECQAAGNPPPQISWLKDSRPLLLSPRTRLLSGDSLLRSVWTVAAILFRYYMFISEVILDVFLKNRIAPVQLSDSGVYTCVARSRAGLAELSYDVQVQGTITRTYYSLLAVFRNVSNGHNRSVLNCWWT